MTEAEDLRRAWTPFRLEMSIYKYAELFDPRDLARLAAEAAQAVHLPHAGPIAAELVAEHARNRSGGKQAATLALRLLLKLHRPDSERLHVAALATEAADLGPAGSEVEFERIVETANRLRSEAEAALWWAEAVHRLGYRARRAI